MEKDRTREEREQEHDTPTAQAVFIRDDGYGAGWLGTIDDAKITLRIDYQSLGPVFQGSNGQRLSEVVVYVGVPQIVDLIPAALRNAYVLGGRKGGREAARRLNVAIRQARKSEEDCLAY